MDAKEKQVFKKILLTERMKVLTNSQKSINEDTKIPTEELADEMDMAAVELNQNLSFRLRDRERLLLSKIDYALKKLEQGSYGECESCGEDITSKRLIARPVSTLCIQCKEKEERQERAYA